MILKEEDGIEFLTEKFEIEGSDPTSQLTYINGKLVSSEELDKAMIKNMETCASKDIFLDDRKEEKLMTRSSLGISVKNVTLLSSILNEYNKLQSILVISTYRLLELNLGDTNTLYVLKLFLVGIICC